MPAALEAGIASMARQERAVISCSAEDAAPLQPQSLVPAPPADAERVEFEVELLSLTQVRDRVWVGERWADGLSDAWAWVGGRPDGWAGGLVDARGWEAPA